jgi:hypothetical protein
MRRKASTSRLVLLASVAFLSIFLLSLSWPRLQASLRFLPVDIGMARYYRDQQIPTDRLAVLIRFALEAIGHHDHYRYHNGLSLLHYLRALDVYTPARERRDAYRQAEAAAMASLSQAPAQPAAWLRLSTIRWICTMNRRQSFSPGKCRFSPDAPIPLFTHTGWRWVWRSGRFSMMKVSPCCVISYCLPGKPARAH